MNAEDLLLLRREVRTAVFRAARLRRAGRDLEADEQLAAELAGAQARLASHGVADAAGEILRWRMEDDAAFAIALMIGEIVLEGLNQPSPAAVPAPGPATAAAHPSPVSAHAFPPPPTGVPGLADLLDEMLSQERRPRPHPS